MEELLRLARETFSELTDAEETLIKSVSAGIPADYSSPKEEENDLTISGSWNVSRIIKSPIITWLCINKSALKLVTRNGIQIICARIVGNLNLQFINISFPLIFSNCAFSSPINLDQSKIAFLNLNKSHTKEINAAGLEVSGDVYFGDGFIANGQISLRNAKIHGQLNFDGGKILNKGKYALFADSITVGGDIFFREKFYCDGEIRLIGAHLQGSLEFTSSQIINPEGYTLIADGINIGGQIALDSGFRSEGELRLTGANLLSILDCDGGKFLNESGVAISADGIKVTDIFFRSEFEAQGIIRLVGSRILGSLECDTAKIINPAGYSLFADRMRVEGDVYLRKGFQSSGILSMSGATISGNLECDGGVFKNAGNNALNLQNISVGGHVFLRNNFDCEGIITLATSKIEGVLSWEKVIINENCELDLRSASIRSLKLDISQLPGAGNLDLNNLVYDELIEDKSIPVDEYYELLNKQGMGYSPQPYEQLAKVLRVSGRGDIATKILIKNKKDEYAKTEKSFFKTLYYYFLKTTLGFGYETWRPLVISFILISIGSLVFLWAFDNSIITPVLDAPNDHNNLNISFEFHPFVYSLDAFIPFIELPQTAVWLPDVGKGNALLYIWKTTYYMGGVILFYLYFHIFLGWLFISIFIVGLSGIIKK